MRLAAVRPLCSLHVVVAAFFAHARVMDGGTQVVAVAAAAKQLVSMRQAWLCDSDSDRHVLQNLLWISSKFHADFKICKIYNYTLLHASSYHAL